MALNDRILSCMNYLVQYMTKESAAGIVGNLTAESSCRTDIRSDSSQEIGIAGFTREAYTGYLAYAEKTGRAWDSLECQLDYLLDQAENTRFRYQASVNGDTSQQYGSVTHLRECGYGVNLCTWSDFAHTNSVQDAAVSFLGIYEDCIYERTATYYGRASLQAWADEQVSNRVTYARNALDIYNSSRKESMFSEVTQGDSRWANHAFGNGGETFSSSACGLFAICIILGYSALEQIEKVYSYLLNNGFATDHSGTWQAGIYKALIAFGVNAEQITGSSIGKQKGTSYMTRAKSHVISGFTLILLMGSANAGTGLTNKWTIGGHYVAITKYNKATGKFWVQDPAGRNTGWWSWDEIDTGDVKHVFLVYKAWDTSATTQTTTATEEEKMYKQALKLKVGMGKQNSTVIGLNVLLLQELLKAKGYKAVKEFTHDGKKYTTNGDGKALSLDRDFGNNTAAALMNYKADNGLTIDAVCDEKTWLVLLGGI